MSFSRTFIIPAWFVVLAVFVISGWPMPLGLAMLLALVGVAVPVIVFTALKERALTAGDVVAHPADARREIRS